MLTNIVQHISSVACLPLAATALTLLLTVLYYFIRDRGLPPGPIGLPYIGYWPFLKSDTCHEQFEEMKKKHGDLFSIKISGRLYINLGSHKAIREAHLTNSDCFAGRVSDFDLLNMVFEGGVSFINGEPWKVLRKFFLQALKEYGFTSIKDHMAGPMYDSINDVVEELRTRKGEPVNLFDSLTDKCTSIVRKMLFSDVGMSDEQAKEMNKHYLVVLDSMTATNLILGGPIAKYLIFPLLPSFRKASASYKMMEQILYTVVKEHESTFDENHIRDIVDFFIKERNDRKRKGDPTAEYFTDRALVRSLSQIVGDGMNAVASFVNAFFYSLLQHPEQQDKLYQELIEVLGPDKQPSVEDRGNLPYMNAFIHEVSRMSNFFPFFPSLECTKETTLRGYRIPKGSITLLNIYMTHHDTEAYEEPEKFNPSRFITTPGKKRSELPVTFGVGKRACIGEGFTMMQVFLFLSTMIKNFHLSLHKPFEAKSYLLSLEDWKLCAHPRSSDK